MTSKPASRGVIVSSVPRGRRVDAAAAARAAGQPFTSEDRDAAVRQLCEKDEVLRHRSTRWVDRVAIPAAADYVGLDGSIRPAGPRHVNLIAATTVAAPGDTITATGISEQFDAMCDELNLNNAARRRAAARLANELAAAH